MKNSSGISDLLSLEEPYKCLISSSTLKSHFLSMSKISSVAQDLKTWSLLKMLQSNLQPRNRMQRISDSNLKTPTECFTTTLHCSNLFLSVFSGKKLKTTDLCLDLCKGWTMKLMRSLPAWTAPKSSLTNTLANKEKCSTVKRYVTLATASIGTSWRSRTNIVTK